MSGAGPLPAHLYVAEAPDLRIRRKVPHDAMDDFAWRRNPETARFDGQPALAVSYPEFARALEHEIAFPDPRRRPFSIETPRGLHFGNIMYYNADGESAELGVSIGLEDYRGRGLGTSAVVAFVRFIFATTPIRRLYLHTLEWNARARRCFERAGFDATARVERDAGVFLRMEVRREWWLLWDMEGRFAPAASPAP